jgi:hypothetical protein
MLTQALALLDPDDDAVGLSFESRRQLALAEAGLGRRAEAAHMLDQLLAQHAGHDNPLLMGLFHKARAELAIALADEAAFELHLAATEQRFRATRNPALIAQCEQLIEAGRRGGLRGASAALATIGRAGPVRSTTGQRSIAELTAAADRSEYALWLILERTVAKSGYLYVMERGALRLAAASTRREPSPELERELQALAQSAATVAQLDEGNATIVQGESGSADEEVARASSTGGRTVVDDVLPLTTSSDEDAGPRASVPGDGERTVFVASLPAPGRRNEHQLLLLRVTHGQQRDVVGGVILELAAADLGRLPSDMLDAVANALADRCTTGASQLGAGSADGGAW